MQRRSILVLLAPALGLALAAQPAPKVATPYTQPTSGEQVYLAYCASCHGVKGLGDGPVAASLKNAVPNLATLAQRNQGKFPAAGVSQSVGGESMSRSHGTADMPVWGPVFRTLDSRSEGATNIRVYNLVKHIESLQTK